MTSRQRWVKAALWAIVGFLVVMTAARFKSGLGSTTNLTDVSPWGLWIAFDVMAGVALAAGGFVLAATVHIFHLEKYHRFVRPAILTALLGYIAVAVGLLYDLGLPTPECECAGMNYQYSLSYVFPDALTSNPDVITDQYPEPCASWNDYGLGWYDLVADFGYPGSLMTWADVSCCQSPVGNADETWGGVKSLYE